MCLKIKMKRIIQVYLSEELGQWSAVNTGKTSFQDGWRVDLNQVFEQPSKVTVNQIVVMACEFFGIHASKRERTVLFKESGEVWFSDGEEKLLRNFELEYLVNPFAVITLRLMPLEMVPPPKLQVSVRKVIHLRGFTVYRLLVSSGKLEWEISKRYSEFRALHKDLSNLEVLKTWLDKKQQDSVGAGPSSSSSSILKRIAFRNSSKQRQRKLAESKGSKQEQEQGEEQDEEEEEKSVCDSDSDTPTVLFRGRVGFQRNDFKRRATVIAATMTQLGENKATTTTSKKMIRSKRDLLRSSSFRHIDNMKEASSDSIRKTTQTFPKRRSVLQREKMMEDDAIPRVMPSFPGKQFLTRHSQSEVITAKRREELEKYLVDVINLPPFRDNLPVPLLVFLGMMRNQNGTENESAPAKIHITKIKDLAESGDLILFKSANTAASLQRTFTNSDWDHVAIVVKREGVPYLELLEATADGVECYPLVTRLRSYSEGYAKVIAIRRLEKPRSLLQLRVLSKFANKVQGKPYNCSLNKLFFTRNTQVPQEKLDFEEEEEIVVEEGQQKQPEKRVLRRGASSVLVKEAQAKSDFFCSELVAEALIHIGVLPKHHKSTYYWPVSFSQGGEVEKLIQSMNPDIQKQILADPVEIDCTILELSNSRTSNPTNTPY